METNNGNYITGFIGALLGGLIASLPWIICYVFLEMILSVLAIPIALGAFYGYKLFRGPQNKAAIVIVVLVTLVIVAIDNFVIIPGYYLVDAGYPFNMTYLKWYFSSSELMGAVIKDFIVSIIFALLGISGTMKNIQNEIQM